MKEPRFKFRDILALPFAFLMWLFGMWTVKIGGEWTAYKIYQIWGWAESRK